MLPQPPRLLAASLVPLVLIVASACGDPATTTSGSGGTTSSSSTTSTSPGPVATLSLTLSRGPASEVLATIHARDKDGAPVTGAPVKVAATSGTPGEVSEKGQGDYTVSIAPTGTDLEVEIDAEVEGIHARKTAIVLSTVDSAWDQPEALDGFVNTPGWEDGASVSADGEWLLLGTYVPLDILTCQVGGAGGKPSDPTSPACNTLLGPYAAPERPDMLGADRIVSPTKIKHACPSLGFPAGGGEAPFALPPVAAYGFHRQADGSYREPFVIGFAADGCLGPYGLSFAGPISGTSAAALFANDDPLTSGPDDTANDLYWSPLTLGQKNIFATYSFDGSKVQVSGNLTTRLPLPDLSGTQGNVNFSAGRLWWDDESVAGENRQIYFADVTGDLPKATFSKTQIAGVSRPGQEDIQPTLDGPSLYWMGGGHVLTSNLTSSADPALPGSWTPPTDVLGPGSSPDKAIVATGEPTLAHMENETWLYFVYIRRTPTGYDGNVGRIRKRK